MIHNAYRRVRVSVSCIRGPALLWTFVSSSRMYLRFLSCVRGHFYVFALPIIAVLSLTSVIRTFLKDMTHTGE